MSNLPPYYCKMHLNIILSYLRRSFKISSHSQNVVIPVHTVPISLRFILISFFHINLCFSRYAFLSVSDDSIPTLSYVYTINFRVIHLIHIFYDVIQNQITPVHIHYFCNISFNIIFQYALRSSNIFCLTVAPDSIPPHSCVFL
jgi:hypothetical protein